MNSQKRHRASELRIEDVPAMPGIYAWYLDGEPIYSGRATVLRERIKRHLGTGTDLSRSSFRRNVCEAMGIAPTAITRQRPTKMSAEQVAAVNEYIRGAEVAWLTCATAEEATRMERALHAEHLPPLSKR